jgi:hypothetical protein
MNCGVGPMIHLIAAMPILGMNCHGNSCPALNIYKELPYKVLFMFFASLASRIFLILIEAHYIRPPHRRSRLI